MRPLVTGTVGIALLVFACCFGPLVLPATGDGDPLHAALLPPGTSVTVLALSDGRTLLSPDITREDSSYLVGGRHGATEIPRAQVENESRVRLWLGSDRFGRDVLLRLLEGGRLSLLIATLGWLFTRARRRGPAGLNVSTVPAVTAVAAIFRDAHADPEIEVVGEPAHDIPGQTAATTHALGKDAVRRERAIVPRRGQALLKHVQIDVLDVYRQNTTRIVPAKLKHRCDRPGHRPCG